MATPDPKCIIDHTAFPHIMDVIIDAAGPEARWALSQTCRAIRKRCNVDIGCHVGFSRVQSGNGTHMLVELQRYLGASDAYVKPTAPTGADFLEPRKPEQWDRGKLRSYERAWFDDVNITTLDLRGNISKRQQSIIYDLMTPKIVRCPTVLEDWAPFVPEVFIFPVKMQPTKLSGCTALLCPLVKEDVSRVVFALEYGIIPAVRILRLDRLGPRLTNLVIHISTSRNANYDDVPQAHKALNFNHFNDFLTAICTWVMRDITIVGLERVAGTLFGQATIGGETPPSIAQQLAKCVPQRANHPLDLTLLSKSEYLELHDMSPLMLAIERGANYY